MFRSAGRTFLRSLGWFLTVGVGLFWAFALLMLATRGPGADRSLVQVLAGLALMTLLPLAIGVALLAMTSPRAGEKRLSPEMQLAELTVSMQQVAFENRAQSGALRFVPEITTPERQSSAVNRPRPPERSLSRRACTSCGLTIGSATLDCPERERQTCSVQLTTTDFGPQWPSAVGWRPANGPVSVQFAVLASATLPVIAGTVAIWIIRGGSAAIGAALICAIFVAIAVMVADLLLDRRYVTQFVPNGSYLWQGLQVRGRWVWVQRAFVREPLAFPKDATAPPFPPSLVAYTIELSARDALLAATTLLCVSGALVVRPVVTQARWLLKAPTLHPTRGLVAGFLLEPGADLPPGLTPQSIEGRIRQFVEGRAARSAGRYENWPGTSTPQRVLRDLFESLAGSAGGTATLPQLRRVLTEQVEDLGLVSPRFRPSFYFRRKRRVAVPRLIPQEVVRAEQGHAHQIAVNVADRYPELSKALAVAVDFETRRAEPGD